MIDLTWDGNPDTLALMESQVRTADWVVNRVRSLYTSEKISATAARQKLEAIGVIPERVEQYIAAWGNVVQPVRATGRIGQNRQQNAPPRGLPNTPAPPLPAPRQAPGDVGIGAGVAFEFPPSTGGGRRG